MYSYSVLIETTQKSPIAHEWRISQKRLNNARTSKGYEQLSSKYENVPGHKCLKYVLHLMYGDINHPGHAILKFELQNLAGKEYQSNITFGIESCGFKTKKDAVFDSENKTIEIVICKWEELFFPEAKYINDDEELVIKCEGLIIGNIMYYPIQKRFPKFEHGLKLWEDNNGKTANIDVKGQQIYLDKKVFAQMFNPNLFRYTHASFTNEFKYKTIERAVKFHYHPHLVYPATFDELMDVAEFLERFGSYDSKELFAEFLIQQINEYTVCSIAKSAVQTGHEILQLKCADFLRDRIRNETPIASFGLLPKKFATDVLESCLSRRSYAE